MSPSLKQARKRFTLAVKAHEQNRLDRAQRLYQQVLSLVPNHAPSLNNLGMVYHLHHQIEKAHQCFLHASNLDPTNAAYHNNLGNTYKLKHHLTQALPHYLQALKLNSNYIDVHFNLGVTYQQLNQHPSAVKHLQHTLQLNPNHQLAYYHLGISLRALDQLDQALDLFHQAISQPHPHPHNLAMMYHLCQLTCNWDQVTHLQPQLDKITSHQLATSQQTSETPYIHLTHHIDPSANLQVATSWSTTISSIFPPFSPTHAPSPSRPIRLGYLSYNFAEHPIAHLTNHLFSLHNRDNFHVTCLTYSPQDNSPVQKHIYQSCDQLIDLFPHDVTTAAHLIRQHIDILIDLTHHTQGNRIAIPAHHPSPLQISYLGLPSSSGAQFFDYFISDSTITSTPDSKFYTEQLIRLPHTYQINSPPPIPPPPSRSTLHLPPGAFIFASFNSSTKITRSMFHQWLRLLERLPHSILWLLESNSPATKNLSQFTQNSHLKPSRLIFAPHTPKPAHLSRLQLIDLALDTFPYTGHTTTSDCLLATIPVITTYGPNSTSRVSASLLRALGLPELITPTIDDYYHLALHLATHPQKLLALRHKLLAHKHKFPLFDTARFTHNLETAYLTAWHRYLKGQPPRSFQVKDPLPLHS